MDKRKCFRFTFGLISMSLFMALWIFTMVQNIDIQNVTIGHDIKVATQANFFANNEHV